MQEKKYKLAAVIGRFEGFHLMHEDLIKEALTIADDVVILIGSAYVARDIKNPWLYSERTTMIQTVFPDAFFRPIKDNDSDDHWIMQVQKQVASVQKLVFADDKETVLVGHKKDASSFYLDLFPSWDKHMTQSYKDMDATTIRNLIFSLDLRHPVQVKLLEQYMSKPVIDYLKGWFMTPAYPELMHEYEKNQGYKQAWSAAPHKPIFVTTDAVVVCAGHVLMVRRKHAPGKGLLALPGGFLEQGERIVDGIIRELKEETGINVNKSLLKSYLTKVQVFDNPGRSRRGRTVTHAGLIELPFMQLPEVKGDDDAEIAIWVPFAKFPSLCENIFEDHSQIVGAMKGIEV